MACSLTQHTVSSAAVAAAAAVGTYVDDPESAAKDGTNVGVAAPPTRVTVEMAVPRSGRPQFTSTGHLRGRWGRRAISWSAPERRDRSSTSSIVPSALCARPHPHPFSSSASPTWPPTHANIESAARPGMTRARQRPLRSLPRWNSATFKRASKNFTLTRNDRAPSRGSHPSTWRGPPAPPILPQPCFGRTVSEGRGRCGDTKGVDGSERNSPRVQDPPMSETRRCAVRRALRPRLCFFSLGPSQSKHRLTLPGPARCAVVWVRCAVLRAPAHHTRRCVRGDRHREWACLGLVSPFAGLVPRATVDG